MFVHPLPRDRSITARFMCSSCQWASDLFGGKVSEVRQRVQAPHLVWTLPTGWLPPLWDFQQSHHIHLAPVKGVPKWLITATSFLHQEPVMDYTHPAHLDNYQISLLIDWHQIFGFKYGDTSDRNTLTSQFHRDLKQPQPSRHLSLLPLSCPFAGIAPSIPAAP